MALVSLHAPDPEPANFIQHLAIQVRVPQSLLLFRTGLTYLIEPNPRVPEVAERIASARVYPTG